MIHKRECWRVGASAVAIALVAFALAVPASAQEQVGAIIGSVTDTSGAVLPGTTVEAVSAGGARLSTVTNADGEYRFPRVPPGSYTLKTWSEKLGVGTAAITVEAGQSAATKIVLARP